MLERQILVRLCTQHPLFDLLQQGGKRQQWVKLRSQYLGVGEKADQAFGLDPGTVGHRHADTHSLLAAVAVQQGLE